ncbi:MAG: hypothetical protein ACOYJG_01235 [Prevotella sp.]|jgi:hypothetical protein
MKKIITIAALLLCCFGCGADDFTLFHSLNGTTFLRGNKSGGNYLYVTASPKIYSIGNQLGQFPSVGFHIPGEMGGIWMQPIKLLDGFGVAVNDAPLTEADDFLTYPYATQFVYHVDGLTVVRTDIAIDSSPVLVSEWVVNNPSDEESRISVDFALLPHLSPTWLAERQGIIDGKDQLLHSAKGMLSWKDEQNNWFASAKIMGMKVHQVDSVAGNGSKSAYHVKGSIKVAPHASKTIRLYISGSLKSESHSAQMIETTMRELPDLFKEKQRRYKKIDQTAELLIPDSKLQQAYQWGKYSTDWLIRDVEGLGRGISAGLPDYPWFFSNDQSTTFKAIVGTMDPAIMNESIDMLLKASNAANNNSGRIIHEMSANGQVFDNGRMEESQEFIDGAWTLYKWTGNKELLDKIYEQAKRIDAFLMANDKDHDLFVEGYGGVEIEGLNDEMFDVACWTTRFYRVMSEMSMEKGLQEDAKTYAAKADTLTNRINRYWWCADEHRYYDMLTDSATALKLIDKALKDWVSEDRNMWAKNKLLSLRQQIITNNYHYNGYNIFYNPSTPALTTGVADSAKARSYLKHIPFFCNKFGLYISGISRPDDITLEEGSVISRLKGEFNYKQAVMTGATSALAIAQCMYNDADSSLQYIDKILNNFSFATPGTTYEVCPDYGMFVQAWNVTGLNIPIIQYFFGISPFASHKQVIIAPDMPSGWKKAEIKNLLIGSNKLSVAYENNSGNVKLEVKSFENGWRQIIRLPQNVSQVYINGKLSEVTSHEVLVEGINNVIVYQE